VLHLQLISDSDKFFSPLVKILPTEVSVAELEQINGTGKM
jgi:hypothetical protein